MSFGAKLERLAAGLHYWEFDMARKSNYPDSDQSARKSHPAKGDEDVAESTDETVNVQTSHKSGKHSSIEKLSASRPEFGEGRGAQPVEGAFGSDEESRKG